MELVERFEPPPLPYVVVSACLFRLPRPYAPLERYTRGLVELAEECARERRFLRVYLDRAAATAELDRRLGANPFVQRVDVHLRGASPFFVASLRLLPLARRHAAGAARVVVQDVDQPHARRGPREARAALAAGHGVTLMLRPGYRFKWGERQPLAGDGAVDSFWAPHGAPVLPTETLRDAVEACVARPPRDWSERFDVPEVRELVRRRRGPGALDPQGVHYGFDEYLLNHLLLPAYLEQVPCHLMVYLHPGYHRRNPKDPLWEVKARHQKWMARFGTPANLHGHDPAPPRVPWDVLVAGWAAERAAEVQVPALLGFRVRGNPGATRG